MVMTMIKKITLLPVLIIFAFTQMRCTDFIAGIDKDKDWKVSESGQVILHYRSSNFSNSVSPDNGAVEIILQNQNRYLKKIEDKLHKVYSGNVLIYLYNQDEAKEKIGTSTGGHSIPQYLTYYYAFQNIPVADSDGFDAYIGAHELVHVVSFHLLGTPGTRMMSEGYAVAIDGSYAFTKNFEGGYQFKSVKTWMSEYYREGKILKPSQMLANDDLAERIFYPNAGYFVNFIFNTYGIQTANKLFIASVEDFKNEFKKLTGQNFNEMEKIYGDYCSQNL